MTVEPYWMPGCSSCLRMKEFVERAGVDYVAITVDQEPQRAARLREQGIDYSSHSPDTPDA
ncbi:hypothetical protein M1247_11910 [Mycobacterium sp. 21AC1]|uniref:glutaredoxin family protein n=1 Tax=[Mycobacterium] appelbergii TaxID=2939269 RepID=UPI0029391986|nr:glutaredoxin domain-containing protein [Mycobacterium sp. 21AC1]MDV3125621.1 hypothetical protein [Mycobacterium sp. 21AC1]